MRDRKRRVFMAIAASSFLLAIGARAQDPRSATQKIEQ